MCYVYTIYSVNAVEIVDSMNLSSSFVFGNFLEFIFYPWLAEFGCETHGYGVPICLYPFLNFIFNLLISINGFNIEPIFHY